LSGAKAVKHTIIAAQPRNELERRAEAAVEHNVDLGYEGPESGAPARGEPQLLRDLIGNPVANAIRYGRSGGEVTLGVRESPLTLFVDDDRAGIAPPERDRVLEPFYRAPRSNGDGCGLGLGIASQIAARHGARLRIRNYAPTGTRVEVVFGN